MSFKKNISPTKTSKANYLLFIFVFMSISYSCDNTLEPLDKETGVYAIYGALDMDEQTNYIRIRDLKAPFTEEATESLDVNVTFENLENGLKSTLDFERQEYEGIYLHNFVVNGEIEPNTKYMVSTKRSDGVTVSITTISPTQPEPDVFPINQNCYTPITVNFEPTNGGKIVYMIRFFLGIEWKKGPYILESGELDQNTMSFTFTPKRILSTVISLSRSSSCYDLDQPFFDIIYAHYSPGLYPYEEIPADQEPFNIFQSTQVFGAFYKDTLNIPIDTARVCPLECD